MAAKRLRPLEYCRSAEPATTLRPAFTRPMIPLERWSRPGLAALRPRYCHESGESGLPISLPPGHNLGDGRLSVGRIEIAEMPSGLFFHVGNPLAFDGAGNDATRSLTLIVSANAAQEFGRGGEVVPVNLMNLPSKGSPFVGERLDVHHLVHFAVELVAVSINDGDQGARFVLGGRDCRLPHLSFLHLAVAHHAEDPIALAGPALRERHPEPVGQRMADGAGGEVHAGDLAHVGVIPKRAPETRVVVEPRFREKAEIRVDGKESDSGVPLADCEAIARWPTRLARFEPHHVVIERGEKLGGREDR